MVLAAALAAPAQAMHINPVFDSSITSRSNAAQIESAFNAAASQFDSAFKNPATVNISVSWGSVGGQTIAAGDLGQSIDNLSGYYSYSSLSGYLRSVSAANPADKTLDSVVDYLPKSDPTRLNQFEIPYAEAKAIGLLPSSLPITDGYIGFSSTAAFDFNPAGGVSSGYYDFQGLAAHEIEEVLGRITGLQSTAPQWATPFDLLRYSSAYTADFSYTKPGYFSINGGLTDLGGFNVSGAGDRSDWVAIASVRDVQNAYLYTGKALGLSDSDLAALDALGWGVGTLSGTSLAPTGTLSSAPSAGLSAVPEPATWTTLSLGLGLSGFLLRRRRNGHAPAV